MKKGAVKIIKAGEREYPTTLEEVGNVEGEVLYPWHIVKILKTTENTLNCAAKAGNLPYGHVIEGRTVIFKRAFLHYCLYGQVSCGTVRNPLIETVKVEV